MARHYSTRSFFRQLPNNLLARYFEGFAEPVDCIPFDCCRGEDFGFDYNWRNIRLGDENIWPLEVSFQHARLFRTDDSCFSPSESRTSWYSSERVVNRLFSCGHGCSCGWSLIRRTLCHSCRVTRLPFPYSLTSSWFATCSRSDQVVYVDPERLGEGGQGPGRACASAPFDLRQAECVDASGTG